MLNTDIKYMLRHKYKSIREDCSSTIQTSIRKQVNASIEKRYHLKNNHLFIGIYWPILHEVSLLYLKDNPKYRLALPATLKDGVMNYYPWEGNILNKDINGIPAPTNQLVLNPTEITLLLVPGIAIDKEGYRLGYGGGYFDRLRSKAPWQNIPSFVVLPQNCISKDPLPRDPWDIPFDGWISEEGESKIKNSSNL